MMPELARQIDCTAIDRKSFDIFIQRLEKLLAQCEAHCSSPIGATSELLSCGLSRRLCDLSSRDMQRLAVLFSTTSNSTIHKKVPMLKIADITYLQKSIYRKKKSSDLLEI